mmetsp:Transcript_20903/g.57970  ORF Transcript_20903/g.57970 Transcript_20903/m.57970 type:complete len:129 (+) Transcript_20903:48-434(+)
MVLEHSEDKHTELSHGVPAWSRLADGRMITSAMNSGHIRAAGDWPAWKQQQQQLRLAAQYIQWKSHRIMLLLLLQDSDEHPGYYCGTSDGPTNDQRLPGASVILLILLIHRLQVPLRKVGDITGPGLT